MNSPPRLAEQASFGELATRANGSRAFVRDLREGDRVAEVFVVRERNRSTRRNGDDFLRLVVADRTGAVEAVSWDEVDAHFELTEPGSIVHIEGPYTVHPQYGAKITVKTLRRSEPDEYRTGDLVESAPVPLAKLEEGIRDIVATVQDRDLRALLVRFFSPGSRNWDRFRVAPAAKYYHQAYAHGLLDHSLSVAHGVSAAASAFPGIDRDVAVAGALLHDVGKMQAYNDDPLAIDLTDAGRLQGEIALGYYLVRSEIESIDGFNPETAQAILHIILSHHGALEYGSPVVPATREATLVHAIDNLGGKLGSFDRIERELPEGERWSKFDRGIGSGAYFAGRRAA